MNELIINERLNLNEIERNKPLRVYTQPYITTRSTFPLLWNCVSFILATTIESCRKSFSFFFRWKAFSCPTFYITRQSALRQHRCLNKCAHTYVMINTNNDVRITSLLRMVLIFIIGLMKRTICTTKNILTYLIATNDNLRINQLLIIRQFE